MIRIIDRDRLLIVKYCFCFLKAYAGMLFNILICFTFIPFEVEYHIQGPTNKVYSAIWI